ADHTTDVWAFGCVLYEMLSGKRAFDGETTGEILAGIFKGEPDWSGLPATVPQSIRRLIERCLRKERRRRIQSIGDVRIEIEDVENAPPTTDPVRPVPRKRERLLWISALILVAVAAGSVVLLRRPSPAPEMRLEIQLPTTTNANSLEISPDGQKVAYVAVSER